MAAPAKPSASFFDHFDSLEDPRIERCRLHPLRDLVFIAVCALIGSANDFVALEQFGRTRRAWLEKFLELPNGVPSHDPFGHVFAALDAEPFIRCFLSWVASIHEITAGQVVRIDGQTARASLDRAQGKHPLHVVSAWASANRLVLGQVMVDEKSNAITALPRLLEMLELRGAIVTIDAMGCQKEIAAKVRERGADYVLTVKGNQDPLEEDVIDHFAALDDGGRRGRRRSRHDTADEGHGRQESWYYEAVPAPRDCGTGRPRPTGGASAGRRASGVRRGRSDRRCVTSSAACRRTPRCWGRPSAVIGASRTACMGCWTWFSRRTAAAPHGPRGGEPGRAAALVGESASSGPDAHRRHREETPASGLGREHSRRDSGTFIEAG